MSREIDDQQPAEHHARDASTCAAPGNARFDGWRGH
jgi:hypothetical protein